MELAEGRQLSSERPELLAHRNGGRVASRATAAQEERQFAPEARMKAIERRLESIQMAQGRPESSDNPSLIAHHRNTIPNHCPAFESRPPSRASSLATSIASALPSDLADWNPSGILTPLSSRSRRNTLTPPSQLQREQSGDLTPRRYK
jgi:hypothetical protein